MHPKNKAPQGQVNSEGNPLLSLKRKAPAFQFYANDWLADSQLVQVSLSARGLWIELLCRMWVSDKQGYLILSSDGTAPILYEIAKACRSTEAETEKALKELERYNIFSKTSDGVIYSRRMLRDIELRKAAIEAGKTGGNPLLSRHKTLNGSHNGMVNGHHTEGVKGGVNSKNSSSSSSSPSPSGLNNPLAPLKGGRRSRVAVSPADHKRGF